MGPVAVVVWGDRERELFRDAVDYAQHTGEECAQILREQFGVATACQENVSRWASGATKRPRCAGALLRYAETYGATLANTYSVEEPADATFDVLAARLSDEPLLGPLQSELIRAINKRLGEGPPMSSEDRATYEDQLRILRLGDS